MIAQVIVDVVHTNVDKPFSYLVPQEMNVAVGMRVSVPLGRRQVDGYIVQLLLDDQLPVGLPLEKMRPLTKVLDEYSAILPAMLELAKEIAEDAHCPLAETLRLMLPPAMRSGRIQRQMDKYAELADGVNAEEEAQKQKRAPKRAMLLRLLADGKPHAVSDLSQIVANPRDALKVLDEAGLIKLSKQEVFRAPDGAENEVRSTAPKLTYGQKEALGAMIPSLKEGKGAFLLHGVTGSGKTEVYLDMVRETLAMGRGSIILVPEIALTPQMIRWFRNRFGPETAVLHSRLTDGQRYDEWRRIRLGYARVVVGARSAIFAPIEKLGLIVIDEEHEQTYLSDKHPRYDARHIAMSRTMREGGTLVLSSATPSILSFAMARRGDYTLVEMPDRVNERPLPEVTIVDMRHELEAGNRSIFSILLIQKLKECMDRGEQAMLFLNRRGFNTFISCRSCGYVVKCEQCDLSLTLHREPGKNDPGKLRCHMCGAEKAPPTICPECGSKYIRFFGSGTQRVEEEMHKLFPSVKTVRMDIDTTRGRDAHAKLLGEFGEGRAQVLIGTQMIAKGLDFPRVTLVGVIAADMTLNLPDYRAQERTFQLITQVAGRAGRADSSGEVIVQTYKPDNPCILAAADQDYRAFFEMEFSRRRAGLYPPFTMLARMLVESEREVDAKEMAERLYETIQTFILSHPAQKKRVLLVRMDEAPVKRIRGQHRYHVLLKLFDHADTAPLLRLMSEMSNLSNDHCKIYCEVNPATMM
ncbi:MAG: primosomal protein N' [Clostridiales bacterium]|nr:primosomal protein N' [Clostridiales bacterium]